MEARREENVHNRECSIEEGQNFRDRKRKRRDSWKLDPKEDGEMREGDDRKGDDGQDRDVVGQQQEASIMVHEGRRRRRR